MAPRTLAPTRTAAAFAVIVLWGGACGPEAPATADPGAPLDPVVDAPPDVALLDAAGTLRRASWQLVGRPATAAELAAARGGWDGFDAVVGAMMDEPAFYERLREIFNDAFLTDESRFELSYDTIVNYGIDAKRFPGRAWYSGDIYHNNLDALRSADALAREPLEMVVHAAREGRPLSEIVTARYRLVNPWSARVLGLSPAFKDPRDPDEFVEVQVPALHDGGGASEYAGVLTTTSFLLRYPNTSTNRNRKRARYFYKLFRGYDIMKAAGRLDLSLVDVSQSPWRTHSACTGCHATIDPVAGAFLNWTNCYEGQAPRYTLPAERYCGRGPLAWFPEDQMFPPGTGPGAGAALPLEQQPRGLERLAQTVAADPGFAQAMVSTVLTGLTGWPLLPEVLDGSEPPAQRAAYEAQRALISGLAERFRADQLHLKRLVLAVLRTPAFRADTTAPDRAALPERAAQGGGALLPPEVLHRKIQALLGAPWATQGSAGSPFPDPYHLLSLQRLRIPYGGIDSRGVVTRQILPSALTAATAQRMAYEMACEYTAADLAAPAAARRLLPFVERAQTPQGRDGRDAADAPLLRNLQHLHERLLGEELALDSPELLETYHLLYDLWQEGRAALQAGRVQGALPSSCQATRHFASGQPVAGGFNDDPSYMVRAWQGVIAYLLMDYRFLFN